VKALSMKERMMAGHYYSLDEQLIEEQKEAKRWIAEYSAGMVKEPDETHESYFQLLRKRLGSVGEKSIVRAPFYVDYGTNIHLGRGRLEQFPTHLISGCSESSDSPPPQPSNFVFPFYSPMRQYQSPT